jgi:hypothetical protein
VFIVGFPSGGSRILSPRASEHSAGKMFSVAYAVVRDPVIFLLAKIVVLVETLRC